MNSTFKVVFNKARGALMVVNEATSSVQAKGTKTVIAAAVTALMAGGAMAANLTYDSIVEEEGTFKFISGGGEETHILTNTSVPQLIQELQEAKDLKSFLSALAQVNSEKKTGILLGYAGGQNYMDGSTYTFISAIAIPEGEETVKRILEVTKKQFDAVDSASSLHIDHGTHTIVGTSDSRTSPVVLGLVGSDRVLATGFLDDGNTELVRSGDSVVEVKSGNVIGASIAGSAINVTVATANTTLDGMSRLNVTDTGCIAGAFVGGSAVSILGGKAESLVTDGSQFVLDNKTENSPNGSINTLATGIAGGGLAAGILGGNAISEVRGETTIDLRNGLAMGVMGGGMALSISKATPSKASATSDNIKIDVGTGMTTLGLVGGGVAATYHKGDNASEANSSTGQIHITLGGDVAQPDQTFENKSGLIQTIKNLATNDSVTKDKLLQFVTDIDDYDGATIGVLGGGIALGYESGAKADGEDSIKANSSVTEVQLDVNSGYNVALVGGGFAVGSGHSKTGEDVLASANVEEDVVVNIAGGETVGLMGGGAAVWTGSE